MNRITPHCATRVLPSPPSSCLQLESQLRQLRLRAESEAADSSELKSELEAAQAERISLQKRIGLLSRKNEDLAGENGAPQK